MVLAVLLSTRLLRYRTESFVEVHTISLLQALSLYTIHRIERILRTQLLTISPLMITRHSTIIFQVKNRYRLCVTHQSLSVRH